MDKDHPLVRRPLLRSGPFAKALAIATVGLAITMFSSVVSAQAVGCPVGQSLECLYPGGGVVVCCADYCSNGYVTGFEGCIAEYGSSYSDACSIIAQQAYNFCVSTGLNWAKGGSSGGSSGGGTCVPKTCQSYGATCGMVDDGCGGSRDCGTENCSDLYASCANPTYCTPGFACKAWDSTDPAAQVHGGYCVANMCGTMLTGQELTPGQSVTSCNGQYTLTMQGDGNLVESNGAQAVWATGTVGTAAASLLMQGDGNLVLSDSSRTQPFWASGGVFPGAVLVVQDDGQMVVLDPQYNTRWTSVGGMTPGAELLRGGWMRSRDGRFQLTMQGDGNVVLSFGSQAMWATGTAGTAAAMLLMQPDGNLVLSDAGRTHTFWASGTGNSTGAYLALDDDGQLSVWDAWVPGPPPIGAFLGDPDSNQNGEIWTSYTCCH